MPTEIVSPAYHFCRKLRSFHSSDGITPLTSCGRSIPVFCPRPKAVAYCAIFAIPNLLSQCVEEHVAGLINAFRDTHVAGHAMFCPHPAFKVAPVEVCAAV